MEYHVYWLLGSCFFEIFGDGKYGLFSSQKVDGKMIFTEHCKVLVLKFSEMRNAVFFGAKKLMERWYLLITEKFLFWTFWRMEIRSLFERKSWWKNDIYWILKSSCFEIFRDGKYSLFLSQKVNGKMIFTDYWKILVLNFSVMGNTVFSLANKLMKRWYLLSLFKLYIIFQDLGNIFFRAASNKKNIYSKTC